MVSLDLDVPVISAELPVHSKTRDLAIHRRLRVMHLVSTLNIGGLEKVVYDLARMADQARFDVQVVCLGEVGALGAIFAEAGVQVTALKVHGQGVSRTVGTLLWHLRSNRPDVIHTHNAAPHVAGSIAGRIAGVRAIIHTKHGRNSPYNPRKVFANRLASWFTSRLITVSSDAADVARKIEGVSKDKVQVILNGIDLDGFVYQGEADKRDVCKAIHVARLIDPPKDHGTLLRAVRLVADDVPHFHLSIVGDGPSRAELECLCNDLGLRSNVAFLGFRDDIKLLLSNSGLSILSSTSEGLSITILEAMANGLPVIATRVGGNPEIVKDGETGLLVTPGLPQEMADAILSLIENPLRAARMGQAGRLRVENRFDMRKVVSRYESLYDELGGRNVRPLTIDRLLPSQVIVPAYEGVWHRRSTFRVLRELDESQWVGQGELEYRQMDAARQLLAHAAATCPYYRDEWQRLGLDPAGVESLEDLGEWPLIDRETIRANRQIMRSNRNDLRSFSKATGGSSGVPLQFDVDHGSNDRKMAAWHRGYGWAGAGVGTKQFYLWGVPTGPQSIKKRWKDAIYHWLYRRKVVSCFDLTDERIEWYLRQLNQHRPDAVVAYTNPLYYFARALAARGLKPWQPKTIVVGAEKLHSFQRELIESVFQAPVFETYGSREFMLIGSECQEHAGLHLTMENLIVEVVDDDGRPTPAGEEGNIAITDLTNYALPFIRYLNGDRAIAGFGTCRCGRGLPLLKQVVGRRLDVLRTPDGRMVPGEFFPHLLKDFAVVRRFQVLQPALDRVELKIVRSGLWGAGERESLDGQIREALGNGVKFNINEVDEIPLTSAGKLRVVVSQCGDTESAVGSS